MKAKENLFPAGTNLTSERENNISMWRVIYDPTWRKKRIENNKPRRHKSYNSRAAKEEAYRLRVAPTKKPATDEDPKN